MNKILKSDKIPFCLESSKCCNSTQRENDYNEIGLKENTIPSHENGSHIESAISFVQLVMQTALQTD